MQVSVIIPCYNAATTVVSTIRSVLEQNVIKEIIVVNDGSTDETEKKLSSLKSAILYFSIENSGVSAARNLGISKASGEWIIFVDADDMLVPGTIAKRLQVAEQTGADVVICDWREFREDDKGNLCFLQERSVDWKALNENPEIACATHVWAPPAAIMYRRELVNRIGGFREDLPVVEDARFLFDAAFHGARIAHAPHVGAYYRLSPNSLSRSNKLRFYSCVLKNAQQIQTMWEEREGSLSAEQRKALAGIYNAAARGLLKEASPLYFEAVNCLKQVADALPLHPRLFHPLARLAGVKTARMLASLLGKA